MSVSIPMKSTGNESTLTCCIFQFADHCAGMESVLYLLLYIHMKQSDLSNTKLKPSTPCQIYGPCWLDDISKSKTISLFNRCFSPLKFLRIPAVQVLVQVHFILANDISNSVFLYNKSTTYLIPGYISWCTLVRFRTFFVVIYCLLTLSQFTINRI